MQSDTKMYDQLRKRGQEFIIVFADRTLLSNSGLVLEAIEYARDKGKYERFHENMFLRKTGTLPVLNG